jgi:mono/diheme cytochrome c family protein
LSTSPETLTLGGQVYSKNCAACHGDDGSGKQLGSANFTDQRQMDQLAPRDLYLTVTQGRGSMPSWQSRLSQDERWAVIDYLRTFTYDPALPQAGAVPSPTGAPAGQPTQTAGCSTDQTNPFAWTDAAAIQAGQSAYQDSCAGCHGQDAKGGLPGTPDFTSAKVSADLKANPGPYFCILSEGKGVMPAFGKALSPEQRWQLLTFLGSLGP